MDQMYGKQQQPFVADQFLFLLVCQCQQVTALLGCLDRELRDVEIHHGADGFEPAQAHVAFTEKPLDAGFG